LKEGGWPGAGPPMANWLDWLLLTTKAPGLAAGGAAMGFMPMPPCCCCCMPPCIEGGPPIMPG